ncbi:hypothetical protein A9B99_10820 [Mangrovibacter phragmitis]|uniref:Uncharacterized protein n=1 Tax=Mangrovibacter phragmitis TaxID=1691903 RepID=A0A1B7L0W5_9ENTR|nr:hypothetical protein A9B99_10820 [Mangrovibacter phragmitis]
MYFWHNKPGLALVYLTSVAVFISATNIRFIMEHIFIFEFHNGTPFLVFLFHESPGKNNVVNIRNSLSTSPPEMEHQTK